MKQAAICAVALSLFWSCSFPCEDQLVLEKTSPDQQYIARWVIRDCGATTNYASHVTLAKSAGFLWVNEKRVLVIEGRGPIELTWQDIHTLELAYPRQRTFTEINRYADVQINHNAVQTTP